MRRLLAALLLVQAVLAPALCLGRAAADAHPAAGVGEAVEICTAEGLRVVHLPAGGMADDAGGGPAADHGGGLCLACHGLPQAPEPPVPVLPAPAWARLPVPWAVAAPLALPPAIRGPPSGPRAPPTLLS